MQLKLYKFFPALVVPLLICSCSGENKKSNGPSQASRDHAAWRASLTDSIDSLSALSESLQTQLMQSRTVLDSLAAEFDVVNNPTLVEKYRVAKGWKNYDSTSSTGIVARLLEDNTIELVATLAGGNFNQLSFSANGNSVTTDAVAPDGANNNTIGNVCRVAFCGNKAADVAEFVAHNISSEIKMSYMRSGRSVNTVTLSAAQKKMIAATYNLNDALAATRNIERQLPVIFKKLELFSSETNK